jgi:hypothetical protein
VAVTNCSSGSGNAVGDGGGTDAPVMAVMHPGGSSGGSGSGGSSSGGGSGGSSGGSAVADAGADAGLYDGTVGKACQSNADCQSAGGPGVNRCSSAAGFTAGPLWPTAVCVLTSCDPLGTGNGQLQFCDGPANSPSSPGVCLPTTNPPAANMGVCLPQCRFGADGASPTGCQGKDVCNPAAFGTNAGAVVGFGYCLGGCKADADCPTGSKCQVDEGTCLTTLKTRTKTLGQACTSTDSTSGACFCESNSTTNQGYCTQYCTAGASGVACPSGYLCDTFETLQLNGLAADGGLVPGFTQQNAGLAGACRAICRGTSDAGSTAGGDASGDSGGDAGGDASGNAGGDGGSVCPPSSTCSMAETAGPVCVP